MKLGYRLGILMAMLFMTACVQPLHIVHTRFYEDHPLIQQDDTRPHAVVYFLRPYTEHPLGFADNSIEVNVDGERLLMLAKGEYAVVHLKPRVIDVALRNETQMRGRWEITKLEWARQFDLAAGQTYFIVAEMVDGEFRGVRFAPKAVSLPEAKKISEGLRPFDGAVQVPISTL